MGSNLILVLVVGAAVCFDFTNGFHDTANAMATPIATGALKPKVAVAIAAGLNLVGAFLSTEVARHRSWRKVPTDAQILVRRFTPNGWGGLSSG